jgi:hypothetical protein
MWLLRSRFIGIEIADRKPATIFLRRDCLKAEMPPYRLQARAPIGRPG